MDDTIFALATPAGRSGVAIIRISGPLAADYAASLGASGLPLRRASLRKLVDRRDGSLLDHGLAVRFHGPSSFTGEDVVELHLHGGTAVVRSVSLALEAIPGARQAEPGEFTRRALMNGKLDLAQVEGLGDLIMAETQAQAQQALALMEGQLSELVSHWRERLVRSLALLEASIDFSDDDIPSDLASVVATELSDVLSLLGHELSISDVNERIREGFEVALVGAPNTGKSTLMNTIAKRDVAITSEFAGTTRDVLEVRMDLRGLPVTILDMAGIRADGDPIESLGIAKARRRASSADVRVFLVNEFDDVSRLGVEVSDHDVVLLAKADLLATSSENAVSGLTGQGVALLLDRIGDVLRERSSKAGALGTERQRGAVRLAHGAVSDALAHLRQSSDRAELASADLRSALAAFDFLIGKVDVEDVLDVIFASFCLGK